MTHEYLRSAYEQLPSHQRTLVDRFIELVVKRAGDEETTFERALKRTPLPNDDMAYKIPLVRAAIAERALAAASDGQITVDKMARELHDIMFANVLDVIRICEITGEPIYDLAQLTRRQSAAIKKIKIVFKPSGEKTVEFEMHDKLQALALATRVIENADTDNSTIRSLRDSMLNRKPDITIDQAGEEYGKLIGNMR